MQMPRLGLAARAHSVVCTGHLAVCSASGPGVGHWQPTVPGPMESRPFRNGTRYPRRSPYTATLLDIEKPTLGPGASGPRPDGSRGEVSSRGNLKLCGARARLTPMYSVAGPWPGSRS
eukprot:3532675-Rhodomonas_salina.2